MNCLPESDGAGRRGFWLVRVGFPCAEEHPARPLRRALCYNLRVERFFDVYDQGRARC